MAQTAPSVACSNAAPKYGRSSAKTRTQLRKERNRSATSVRMMGSFRADYLDPLFLPVDAVPSQRKHLAGTPQSTVAAQSDDQAPFVFRTGGQEVVGHPAGHEEKALGRIARRHLDVLKRITGKQALFRR